MAKRLSPARLVLYSLAPCLLLFGALELAARVYEGTQPPPNLKPFDFSGGFSSYSRVFVPDPRKPGLMHTNPAKAGVTFVAQSFPLKKEPGTFRIAALGESSVFYLQKEFEALEQKLKKLPTSKQVQILNAGGQSYGSERLLLVARELLDYSPDMLFVYIGHNEFEEAEQLALIRPALSGSLQAAFESSSLVRLAVTTLSKTKIEKLREEHQKRLLTTEPDTARAWKVPFTKQDVEARMQAFRANLARILELYKARSIPVILSTVPSNLVKPYLPKESFEAFYPAFLAYKQGRFEESKALAQEVLKNSLGRHQSSSLENTIVRELAAQYHVPLLDVETLITEAEPHKIPGETLFADHCHLNAKGNSLLAAGLLQKISEALSTAPHDRP